jgi:hypothetical protein
MFNTIIQFTSGELSSLASTTKTITDRIVVKTQSRGTLYYAPRALKVYNSSGNTVYMGVFTDDEYTYWAANSGLVSDLFPVYNNAVEVVNNLGLEDTRVVVSGIVSGYTGGVLMNFIYG